MYNGEKQEVLWFYVMWESVFSLVEYKQEVTLLGKEDLKCPSPTHRTQDINYGRETRLPSRGPTQHSGYRGRELQYHPAIPTEQYTRQLPILKQLYQYSVPEDSTLNST